MILIGSISWPIIIPGTIPSGWSTYRMAHYHIIDGWAALITSLSVSGNCAKNKLHVVQWQNHSLHSAGTCWSNVFGIQLSGKLDTQLFWRIIQEVAVASYDLVMHCQHLVKGSFISWPCRDPTNWMVMVLYATLNFVLGYFLTDQNNRLEYHIVLKV